MPQAAKASSATTITAGTNQPETWSASRWIGARLRCASATSCTICDSMVSRPTFRASITSAPLWFMVPPMTFAPTSFVTGIDSPVTIDSSTALRPSTTEPSTGTFSPGRTRRRSPTWTLSSCTSSSVPSRLDAARGLGREVEQRADGAARALAGPQLEHLPEQHEHRDDRRRLEIDRDRAVVTAEGGREDAGRERRDDAVDPGHARAHGDQGEHVEVARDERLPAAHEERPAGPEHHRRRQQHLDPVRGLLRDEVVEPGQVAAHLQRDDRKRQHEPDPEPARHVDEFVVRPRLGG